MMIRRPSSPAGDDGLPRRIDNNYSSTSATEERLSRSKQRLQRILQRGQILLCLSFAIMTFALNMVFFAKFSAGQNDIQANISDAPVYVNSDAPILNPEMLRRMELKMRRRGGARWTKSMGIQMTKPYDRTQTIDTSPRDGREGEDYDEGVLSLQPPRERWHKKMKDTSHEQSVAHGKKTPSLSPSYHPKVACLLPNGCHDFISEGIDLLPSLSRYSEDSVPIILSSKHSDANVSYEDDVDDYYGDTTNDDSETTCRQSRSFESRTTIHPTCNDVHALGFDDQMFDKDYEYSRGEYIDFLAVGGANSVWKTTSNHNGENAILKTSKYLKYYDNDKLSLYFLDAMIAGAEGNPQLFTLLQAEKNYAIANNKAAAPTTLTSSSSWNHIMPIYSHCYTATIAPVASGTLKEYVETYPDEHDGETIDPLDKLRLALQVARGLYQIQMYRYGKPTFAHLDLNPSQFLVFHHHRQLQHHQSEGQSSSINNNIPMLQINDFNRGRFLHWDERNNTCPFQFDGCGKNTRGSRWHGPDRFIGCIDVNEKIDTFALGGIFFFLLSDGEAPFYNVRHYGDNIKDGKLPPVPRSAVNDHPAFEALSEMVVRCRALRIEDRPSSLEVVRMLEDKLRKIELG